MKTLKKEVGENDKYTHLQNIFTYLEQNWNKFIHIFITSTNSPTLLISFSPTPEGVFADWLTVF